ALFGRIAGSDRPVHHDDEGRVVGGSVADRRVDFGARRSSHHVAPLTAGDVGSVTALRGGRANVRIARAVGPAGTVHTAGPWIATGADVATRASRSAGFSPAGAEITARAGPPRTQHASGSDSTTSNSAGPNRASRPKRAARCDGAARSEATRGADLAARANITIPHDSASPRAAFFLLASPATTSGKNQDGAK